MHGVARVVRHFPLTHDEAVVVVFDALERKFKLQDSVSVKDATCVVAHMQRGVGAEAFEPFRVRIRVLTQHCAPRHDARTALSAAS